MKKPSIILWVRRDKDYYIKDDIKGYAYLPSLSKDFNKKIKNRLYAVKKWNSVFKVPYIEFRKRLRRIAEETYSSLNVDRIYLWNDEEEFNNLPEGSWVFPVDEDDWIYPETFNNIVSNISNYNSKNMISCDIYMKAIHGRIFYRDSMTLSISFGYFIKTPCNYGSIAAHQIGYINKQDDVFSYENKIIGFKLENISSLSYMQKIGIFKLIRYAAYDSYRVNTEDKFKDQLMAYRELLHECVVGNLIGRK